MNFFKCILVLSAMGFSLQSFADKVFIPAVEELNRQYAFLSVRSPDYKLPFKIYESGPYKNISVNSSAKLCSSNFPYMNEDTFNHLFVTRGDMAALRKGNYEVIKAHGDSRDFGSVCLRGHYEPDTDGDSNGPQEVFVCDEATLPTITRYYVTVFFKTNLNIENGFTHSFLYCVKDVPFGSINSITTQEIKADVLGLGISLQN